MPFFGIPTGAIGTYTNVINTALTFSVSSQTYLFPWTKYFDDEGIINVLFKKGKPVKNFILPGFSCLRDNITEGVAPSSNPSGSRFWKQTLTDEVRQKILNKTVNPVDIYKRVPTLARCDVHDYVLVTNTGETLFMKIDDYRELKCTNVIHKEFVTFPETEAGLAYITLPDVVKLHSSKNTQQYKTTPDMLCLFIMEKNTCKYIPIPTNLLQDSKNEVQPVNTDILDTPYDPADIKLPHQFAPHHVLNFITYYSIYNQEQQFKAGLTKPKNPTDSVHKWHYTGDILSALTERNLLLKGMGKQNAPAAVRQYNSHKSPMSSLLMGSPMYQLRGNKHKKIFAQSAVDCIVRQSPAIPTDELWDCVMSSGYLNELKTHPETARLLVPNTKR